MSDEEIARLILNMDTEDKLPLDMVEQLLKFTPGPDEAALLEEHSYDLDSLARADRFLYEISKCVFKHTCVKIFMNGTCIWCLHLCTTLNTKII